MRESSGIGPMVDPSLRALYGPMVPWSAERDAPPPGHVGSFHAKMPGPGHGVRSASPSPVGSTFANAPLRYW
jgi:hypothetical protein